jgi:hypothetical protein
VLGAAPGTKADPAAKADFNVTPNSIIETPTAIEVDVQNQIWTEDDQVKQVDLDQASKKWQTAASFWNDQNFLHDGKTVRFTFVFSPRAATTSPDGRFHQIEVRWGEPNAEGNYDAYVERGDDPRGPHSGVFPIQISDATCAHEIGHLMNLVDEYAFFATKEDIPQKIQLNGQSLVPLTVDWLAAVATWGVAYGLPEDTPGLMSQATVAIKSYYLDWIVGAIKLGWNQ